MFKVHHQMMKTWYVQFSANHSIENVAAYQVFKIDVQLPSCNQTFIIPEQIETFVTKPKIITQKCFLPKRD